MESSLSACCFDFYLFIFGRKRKLFLPVKLGQYNIPRDIRKCILEGRDLGTIVQALREVV